MFIHVYAKVGHSKFVEMNEDASDFYRSADKSDWSFINLNINYYMKTIVFQRQQTYKAKKKIPVFPLTCSKILGSVAIGTCRIFFFFFSIFLASFYRGHILTLTALVQKWQKTH